MRVISVFRAMLASWMQMYEIEQRTGRRLSFGERRDLAERTYHEWHDEPPAQPSSEAGGEQTRETDTSES